MTDHLNEAQIQDRQSPTFRTLDESEGIYLTEPLPREWPLQDWFASIYDVPLQTFSVFNLARSLRQKRHVGAVLPYCLQALERNPLAGELYDGELITAAVGIPLDYWLSCKAQREALLRIAKDAIRDSDDDDLVAAIEKWIAALLA